MQNAISDGFEPLRRQAQEIQAMGQRQALVNLLAVPAAAGAALYLVHAWEWTYLSVLAWVPAAAFASAWLARRTTATSFLSDLALGLNMVGILLVGGLAFTTAMDLQDGPASWLGPLPALVLLAWNVVCLTGPGADSPPRAAPERVQAREA